MIVVKNIREARKVVALAKRKGKLVGFVPTMGALHEGHLSLIAKARKESGFLAVSIFVNPIQFDKGEDYTKYLRNFKKDEKLLKSVGVDLLFYPEKELMYKKGFSTYVNELDLSKALCGKSRPNHFKGVCTVVVKLFNIIQPDNVYFGQKDYQQALIIKRLVSDLNFSVKIKTLPIVREKDGLALSSRNAYLTKTQREASVGLYQALNQAKKLIKQGQKDPKKIIAKMSQIIKFKELTKVDYIEVVNFNTLEKVNIIKGKVLVALAVYAGKVRLIDNIILDVKLL